MRFFSATVLILLLFVCVACKCDSDSVRLIEDEVARCGEIIDPHLHTAPWFNSTDQLLAELDSANISTALLFNPYPKLPFALPWDINEYVTSIAEASDGRVYALASLNTTHDNWEEHREFEINRLKTFLEKDVVLGAKLAPPHTCLPLNTSIMDDIVEAVNQSSKKLLASHIGNTPFCGDFGKKHGINSCCSREYIDPYLLVPKMIMYPDVKFVLLHMGHEFIHPSSEHFYNFEFVDASIAIAKEYPNAYVSLSAMFVPHLNGTLKYPGGEETLKKVKAAGIIDKLYWASDASFTQGQIRHTLLKSIEAMIAAGYSKEERCAVTSYNTRRILGINRKKVENASVTRCRKAGLDVGGCFLSKKTKGLGKTFDLLLNGTRKMFKDIFVSKG